VVAQSIQRDDDRPDEERDEARIRKAVDLLSHFQRSKARKYPRSNGLGDHTDKAIIKQMRQKHPARKAPVTPLSEDKLTVPRKGMDRTVLAAKLRLKHDVAPGLGCLRNELFLLSSSTRTNSLPPVLERLLTTCVTLPMLSYRFVFHVGSTLDGLLVA